MIVRAAATLVVVAGSVAVPRAAHASDAPVPRTMLSFTSPSGDPLAQGQSHHFTRADGTFAIGIDIDRPSPSVQVDFEAPGESWRLAIAAPPGQKLHPGVFTHAQTQQFGREPGLDFSGNARTCNQTYGSFRLNQVGFDAHGNPAMVDVSFSQRCESPDAPALTGRLLYDALPLSLAVDSSPGDWIGQGLRHTFHNDTAVFTYVHRAGGFIVDVSGDQTAFGIEVDPPVGQRLAVGTYQAAERATKKHAGLYVTAPGRGCDGTNSEFTITNIAYVGTRVSNVSFTFTQHCDGGPPLKGTMRYFY